MSWRKNTLAFALCLSSLMSTANSNASSELDKTIDLWMNEAPLSHVIHQLAELSGGEARITGAVEGEVSGRFFGTVAQTLETLSEEHDILFDLQDGVLFVTSKRALSKVSMVMAGAELNDTLKASMKSGLMPGNDIQIEDELVRLSGHPDFVKRMARQLAAELAITRAKEIEMAAQLEAPVETNEVEHSEVSRVDEPENAEVAKTEVTASVAEPVENSDNLESTVLTTSPGNTDVDIVAPVENVEPLKIVTEVTDKGSEALLADIADEADVETEEVTKTDSFRWVTDIPGFSTF